MLSALIQWIPLLFFTNILYCYGASILDSFVVYHGWKYLQTKQFLIVHQKQSEWIVKTFVFPLVSATILNILLLFALPPYLPVWPVVVSLACMSFNWGFSAFVQIPIHKQLNKAYDVNLLNKVISTNYVRVAVQTLQFLIVIYMMKFCFN